MKSIRSFLVAIGMAIAFIFNLNAQTPVAPSTGGGGGPVRPHLTVPDSLPIGDLSGAWDSVREIYVFSWADQSGINSTSDLVTSVTIPYNPSDGGVDVEEVFRIASEQRLILAVLYSMDVLNIGVYLNDHQGRNLFYGLSSGGINPPVGGSSKNVLGVVLEANPKSWIPFPGAQWFHIVERDENGNAVSFYSSQEGEVYDNGIEFPNYYAPKVGEITIGLADGTEVAYALNGGKKMVPITVHVGIGKVTAIGLRTFRNNLEVASLVVEVSPEENIRNISPRVQLMNDIREGFKSQIQLVAQRRQHGCLPGDVFSRTTGLPCGTPEISAMVLVWPQGTQPTPDQWHPAGPNDFFYLPEGRYWAKFAFPSGWPGDQNQFDPPYNPEEVTPVEEK